MDYIPVGGSPYDSFQVYTPVSGSSLTLPIRLHNCRCFGNGISIFCTPVGGSPIDNVIVYTQAGAYWKICPKIYTPVGGLPVNSSQGLHTF